MRALAAELGVIVNQISKRHLLNQSLSLAISIYMATGCATRQVAFISEPPGAIIKVDDDEHRTPCVLTIPDGQKSVNIVHDSGEVIIVEVPKGNTFLAQTGAVLGKGSAYILYGISIPFILVAAVGAGYARAKWKESSPTYYVDQNDGRDNGLVIKMPLYIAADYLDKISDLKNPVVRVVFPSEKNNTN